MKIFIIPSWYPYPKNPINGTFFKDHAEKLQESGHDVTVIATEIISLKEIFSSRSDLGKKIYNKKNVKTYQKILMNRHPGNLPKFYERYKKEFKTLLEEAIKKEGLPEVFHVHSSLWAGAALCEMKLDVPIIVSEHIKEFLIPEGFDDFQHKLIQNTYNNVQGLIAPSKAVMKTIKETFQIPASCKTQIIPNMVDTEYFVPLKDKAVNEHFSFLIVAMLRPEKRIDTIIKAFIPIGNNFLSRLNILGDGPELKKLQTISNEFNLERQVKFIKKKSRSEVLKNMQKADVCLLFSEMETFGVTLIEALSCGIPVIGGNVGGANDIITPENGLIVPTDNPIALQNAMKYMIKNIKNYDRDKIREDAINRFDKKVVIAKLESIYEEMNDKRS